LLALAALLVQLGAGEGGACVKNPIVVKSVEEAQRSHYVTDCGQSFGACEPVERVRRRGWAVKQFRRLPEGGCCPSVVATL
jgi:hypothetical protein